MSKEHLTRIWQWASITGILFVLASVVSIQGGSSFLGKLVGGGVVVLVNAARPGGPEQVGRRCE